MRLSISTARGVLAALALVLVTALAAHHGVSAQRGEVSPERVTMPGPDASRAEWEAYFEPFFATAPR